MPTEDGTQKAEEDSHRLQVVDQTMMERKQTFSRLKKQQILTFPHTREELEKGSSSWSALLDFTSADIKSSATKQ